MVCSDFESDKRFKSYDEFKNMRDGAGEGSGYK